MTTPFQELAEHSPEMAEALNEITAAWISRSISQDEYQYLLKELQEVRAADALAGNEQAMRVLVAAVSLAATAV
jgi:hypothetical protein